MIYLTKNNYFNIEEITKMSETRNTTQFIMPYQREDGVPEGYRIYPSLQVGGGKISLNLQSLAEKIAGHQLVVIEGYVGLFFEDFRKYLALALSQTGKRCVWTDIASAMIPEEEVIQMIQPFMGNSDSIFGTRTTLELSDYFDPEKLKQLTPVHGADINILYGPGASLAGWTGLLLYIDLPKNELQFRARAQSIRNLGASPCCDMKTVYKQFYFVDWVVLNRHKKRLLQKIDIVIDGQHEQVFPWMSGDDFRAGLHTMANNFFRVRPWFEPGVWGGSWIKENISGLSREASNYAWSFELITPENGIVFESSRNLLEVSFDFLMYGEGDAVLGADREKYGDEFPIRFDFLDTFDGGNLSIQCHPLPEYCKEHFGENITQEETYYILDRKNEASVYLGFQEDIVPEKFETALWNSFNNNEALEITEFVQLLPARKHDLFLIPPGTIHGSGIDNLVLEISTTPYIFTFKMYDWVRPDLDGKSRPVNIDHGMKNLCFDRKGAKVHAELVSKPNLLETGPDWKLFRLPTHPKHTYQVQRYHFQSEINIKTNGKFHVLSLVEGSSIEIESFNGKKEIFRFAETFVVPASAKSYVITNLSGNEAMVVVAMMK